MIDANYRPFEAAPAEDVAEVDLGLRAFLLRVVGQAGLGLLLAAGIAYLVATLPGARDQLIRMREQDGDGKQISLTWFGMAVMVSPIASLLVFAGAQTRLRSGLLFWTFAAAIGASASVLVIAYTGLSIATAFAASAAGFGAFGLFGCTTRRDLTPAAAFFTTGLVGLLVAMGLNIFLGSAALTYAISTIGVVVFAGLIAYDMQRLKLIYGQARRLGVPLEVAANTGALCLFLDFVNLYQFVLMTLGQRR